MSVQNLQVPNTLDIKCHDLDVAGDLTIEGDIINLGNLNVSGDLTVSGTALVVGDFTVSHNELVSGDLVVGGTITGDIIDNNFSSLVAYVANDANYPGDSADHVIPLTSFSAKGTGLAIVGNNIQVNTAGRYLLTMNISGTILGNTNPVIALTTFSSSIKLGAAALLSAETAYINGTAANISYTASLYFGKGSIVINAGAAATLNLVVISNSGSGVETINGGVFATDFPLSSVSMVYLSPP